VKYFLYKLLQRSSSRARRVGSQGLIILRLTASLRPARGGAIAGSPAIALTAAIRGMSAVPNIQMLSSMPENVDICINRSSRASPDRTVTDVRRNNAPPQL